MNVDCEFEQRNPHEWFCTVHGVLIIASTEEPVSCHIRETDEARLRRALTQNDNTSLLRLLIDGMVDAGVLTDLNTGSKGTREDAIAVLATMDAVEVFELLGSLAYDVPAYSSAVRVHVLSDPDEEEDGD